MLENIDTVRATHVRPNDMLLWTEQQPLANGLRVEASIREPESGLVYLYADGVVVILTADQLVEIERAGDEP